MMSDIALTSAAPTPRPRSLNAAELAAMGLVSSFMFLASLWKWWEFSLTEVLGFVTGGVCVWLTVREHVATWPVGLANNLFFLALFWQSRLFADAILQVVYMALGVYGWLNWLYGSRERTELTIARVTRGEWLGLLLVVPLGAWGLRHFLVMAQGAAPTWDAATTVLSLSAQFLLCRKRLEHWLLWMAADVIYIPLYLSRGLVLTAVLYGVFLLMCLFGWREWVLRWRQWKVEAAA